MLNVVIYYCMMDNQLLKTLWLPRWSNMTGHGFSCDATVVIGDRSAWTTYNHKNFFFIWRWRGSIVESFLFTSTRTVSFFLLFNLCHKIRPAGHLVNSSLVNSSYCKITCNSTKCPNWTNWEWKELNKNKDNVRMATPSGIPSSSLSILFL